MNHKDSDSITVSFEDSSFEPVTIPKKANLSEHLTIVNSPILFGCRTGICGTCTISISNCKEDIDAPTEDEKEVLETLLPDTPGARLACQVNLACNATIKMEEDV